jgi:dihydroorotate dehydrogenase (fumarate)
MTSLKTTYMGLELATPLVASSSPLSRDLDGIRALEDAGAGAIVLPSLFEEQISHESETFDAHLEHAAGAHAEAIDAYLPEPPPHAFGCDDYLELVRTAREAVGVPVIASLNASQLGAWVEYAGLLEQAGARAIELNIYKLVTDGTVTGGEVELSVLEIAGAVCGMCGVPVAVKLHPYFSSLASMARGLDAEGAAALVLFNRFYQPDIDLEQLEVVPQVELSTPWEARLPMRWIAILYGRVGCDLAATTGVWSALDAAKMIAAGAAVTMMASALLRHGPTHLRAVERDLRQWLEDHGYESVEQLRGSMSQRKCPDPAAFERAN